MQLQWLQLCNTGFDADVHSKLSSKIAKMSSGKQKKGEKDEEREREKDDSGICPPITMTIVAKLNRDLTKKKSGNLSNNIRLIC